MKYEWQCPLSQWCLISGHDLIHELIGNMKSNKKVSLQEKIRILSTHTSNTLSGNIFAKILFSIMYKSFGK